MSLLNRKRNSRRPPARARRLKLRLPNFDWRRSSVTVVGLSVVAMALAGLGALLNQPIQRVVVSGHLQRVSAMDVEKVVRAELHGAGLVTVNLWNISRGLEALPWVASAAVQRSWPRGLLVEITEQSAVARWNNSGLVNAGGKLFVSDSRFMPQELPQLEGPAGSEGEVTQRYLGAQGRLVEIGMRLATLELDARGAWNMTLDNGVVVRLGRQSMDQRFDRFMQVASKVVSQRATDIAYVDMRYGNGFAIGWKSGAGHAEHSGERATTPAPDHSDG